MSAFGNPWGDIDKTKEGAPYVVSDDGWGWLGLAILALVPVVFMGFALQGMANFISSHPIWIIVGYILLTLGIGAISYKRKTGLWNVLGMVATSISFLPILLTEMLVEIPSIVRAEKIYIGISYDHPEIYYVDFSTVNYEIDSCRIRLIFEYLFSRGILAIIENKTNQEIERIVSAMSSNSGKGIIQIEKSIHDYMVNSISYDYEALRNKSMNRCSFNIYGVINNRLAVCEGIAKFVKLTLNKLGIECFICGGKCTL